MKTCSTHLTDESALTMSDLSADFYLIPHLYLYTRSGSAPCLSDSSSRPCPGTRYSCFLAHHVLCSQPSLYLVLGAVSSQALLRSRLGKMASACLYRCHAPAQLS